MKGAVCKYECEEASVHICELNCVLFQVSNEAEKLCNFIFAPGKKKQFRL